MRVINSLFIGLLAAFATSFATGQQYPTRPVRIVAPNAPASVSDIAERFAFETRTKMLHVPYKGGGPEGVALASGEVLVVPLAASSAIPFVKSGKVKIIAVTAVRRITLAPDWRTVSESGASAEAQSEKYIPRI